MKWLVALSLILCAVAMPLQRVQADNSTAPDFGPLASLVGEWQGKDPDGKPMTVSYQWTGGGTSLVETMTKAQKPVMMTMYHGDNGGLMLTHYCKLGNQPRMRADRPESDAKTLTLQLHRYHESRPANRPTHAQGLVYFPGSGSFHPGVDP